MPEERRVMFILLLAAKVFIYRLVLACHAKKHLIQCAASGGAFFPF
jgi:hypothetical protein